MHLSKDSIGSRVTNSHMVLLDNDRMWLFCLESLCALIAAVSLLLEQVWKFLNTPSPSLVSIDDRRYISRKIL